LRYDGASMPRVQRWVAVLGVTCGAIGMDARPAGAGPGVPNIVVGRAAVEAAPRIDARVAEVTVYSDRARVRRRGSVTLKPGPAVFRLSDLPGAAFIDTVRLSATGARVLRVEAAPVERERFSIEQAKKLLDELDAVNDRFAELEDRTALDDWMASQVTRLAPAPPVPEEKREGRKPLVVDVPSWWKALDFLGERATAARSRIANLADERRELGERRDKLRADLAQLNQGGFSSRVVEVTAVLESAGGTADLQLEYFVPGARWKPAYDLHYAMSRGQLRLDTAAVVEQRTGEDWTDAALLLSTAMPGRGIDLPELLTWTLGERSDFVPRLVPKPPTSMPAPLAAAAPSAPSAREVARGIDEAMLRERLARAVSPDQGTAPPSDANTRRLEDERATRAARKRVALGARSYPSAPSGPAGAPAAAPAMAAMEMPMEAQEAEEPMPMPSAMPTPMSASTSAVRMSKSDRGPSMSSVPLALYDATTSRRPPALNDPFLPAVSAGGLDYVYPAPTPATIPSTGQQVRIPLATQTFRATAFYEATPGLAATAFLRARVRNDGKRPLLRGPATIFGDGELVGVGEIQTTGPGGDIELPLGADQDIRLVRQVVPSTKTTGLIMKSEETTYDVQIQIGNYKKQAATVEVMDQVPTSRRDKVEVKLLGTDPGAQGAPDADGVVRWRVDLPAGTTRTLRLRYQIIRPKDWVLFQR
jgi:hypothetical protein